MKSGGLFGLLHYFHRKSDPELAIAQTDQFLQANPMYERRLACILHSYADSCTYYEITKQVLDEELPVIKKQVREATMDSLLDALLQRDLIDASVWYFFSTEAIKVKTSESDEIADQMLCDRKIKYFGTEENFNLVFAIGCVEQLGGNLQNLREYEFPRLTQ